MILPTEIPEGISISALHSKLREEGCNGCRLGKQQHLKGPILYRGYEKAIWGIFGEAPGKEEDKEGIPFCGPAGRLLNSMLKTMNLSEEMCPIISNGVMCRPIAPAGMGKENLKPQEIDKDAHQHCKPYVEYLIKTLDLKLIVLAGNTAFEAFLPDVKKKSFTSVLEKIFFSHKNWPGIAFIPIYHPAFLLRKKNNPEAYKPYRERTIRCLNLIQECLNDWRNL